MAQALCGIVTALFSPAQSTMQLLMWQQDIVGVAHNMLDCMNIFGALSYCSS